MHGEVGGGGGGGGTHMGCMRTKRRKKADVTRLRNNTTLDQL